MHKQFGAAIILALFVTALVAAAAVAMITRLQSDIRRTELMLQAQQVDFYARGSVAWAMDELRNDWIKQKPNHLIDRTPIQSSNKIHNMTIRSTIYDAQGNFNINNLTDPSYQTLFLTLLKIVSPNLSTDQTKNNLNAILDWISVGMRDSVFDEYYTRQHPSYRSAHRLMFSISELRLIRGITPELFNQLEPFVTALPEVTPININNATLPVIMSLSPNITIASAHTILARCQRLPFISTDSLMNWDIIKNNAINSAQVTVSSHYFLVKTQITVGEATYLIYTLLQRTSDKSNPTMNILWQSKGTV